MNRRRLALVSVALGSILTGLSSILLSLSPPIPCGPRTVCTGWVPGHPNCRGLLQVQESRRFGVTAAFVSAAVADETIDCFRLASGWPLRAVRREVVSIVLPGASPDDMLEAVAPQSLSEGVALDSLGTWARGVTIPVW